MLEPAAAAQRRNEFSFPFWQTQQTNVGGMREPNMPAFIDAKNLQPFVGEDLMDGLKKLEFEGLNGKEPDRRNPVFPAGTRTAQNKQIKAIHCRR